MKIIDNDLLQWFREQPCERCGKAAPSDPHHIMGRGMDGGNRQDVRINLVSLCRTCHTIVQGKSEEFSYMCKLAVTREVYRLRRMTGNSKENGDNCLT